MKSLVENYKERRELQIRDRVEDALKTLEAWAAPSMQSEMLEKHILKVIDGLLSSNKEIGKQIKVEAAKLVSGTIDFEEAIVAVITGVQVPEEAGDEVRELIAVMQDFVKILQLQNGITALLNDGEGKIIEMGIFENEQRKEIL
jgi:hypothetical protein